MSETWKFIARLESLTQGERAQLRCLNGQGLDQSVISFDLFTGVWWPLRNESKGAPRRETAWLIARLFCSFKIPNAEGALYSLPMILGNAEPLEARQQKSYHLRFDALLQSTLLNIEPHLRWALPVVVRSVNMGRCAGLDWAKLLDELSIWDRGDEHRLKRDIQDIWAEQYLNAIRQV